MVKHIATVESVDAKFVHLRTTDGLPLSLSRTLFITVPIRDDEVEIETKILEKEWYDLVLIAHNSRVSHNVVTGWVLYSNKQQCHLLKSAFTKKQAKISAAMHLLLMDNGCDDFSFIDSLRWKL